MVGSGIFALNYFFEFTDSSNTQWGPLRRRKKRWRTTQNCHFWKDEKNKIIYLLCSKMVLKQKTSTKSISWNQICFKVPYLQSVHCRCFQHSEPAQKGRGWFYHFTDTTTWQRLFIFGITLSFFLLVCYVIHFLLKSISTNSGKSHFSTDKYLKR
jgi:hypothetical protein